MDLTPYCQGKFLPFDFSDNLNDPLNKVTYDIIGAAYEVRNNVAKVFLKTIMNLH